LNKAYYGSWGLGKTLSHVDLISASSSYGHFDSQNLNETFNMQRAIAIFQGLEKNHLLLKNVFSKRKQAQLLTHSMPVRVSCYVIRDRRDNLQMMGLKNLAKTNKH